MRACALGKQSQRAVALLDEMVADDSEAAMSNAFAWNNALVACNRDGAHAETMQLYERMRAGAAPITEYTVATVLVACREIDDWQKAQAVFDGCAAARSSCMCYGALLDTLSDAEEWTLLLRYFDAMRAYDVRPTAREYERAIEACDRADTDRALVLFAEMRASGL